MATSKHAARLAGPAAAAILVLLAPAAHADDGALEGDELELEADEPREDEGEENPLLLDARDRDGDVDDRAAAEAAIYPREFARRPLVVPPGVVETQLETRAGVRELVGTGRTEDEAFRASGTLRVDIGVTDELQLGVRYGAGSLGEDGVAPGRAAAVTARYEIFEFLSAEAGLPLHFDPFAAGLSLGAPLKIVIADRLALMAGHDLVTFRLYRFQPRVDEAAENENLVRADEANTVLPDGEYALKGAALYQHSEGLALGAELGTRALDFEARNSLVPAFGILRYAPTDEIDIGARVGAFDLTRPSRNFGGSVFAALRM